MRHQWIITEPPKAMPGTALPDGAVSGNGDASLMWGGSADRVQLYLGKADFWCANGHFFSAQRGGLAAPGRIEILLPQMAYAPYHVEQDMDAAQLRGIYRIDGFDAALTATVCASENTVLLELERTWPGLSASVSLKLPDTSDLAIPENGAVGTVSEQNGCQVLTRVFAGEQLRFPSELCCVLRQVSRTCADGRERIRWAVCIGTNHESAAYRILTEERAAMIDDARFDALLSEHRQWWSSFWSKSSVKTEDEALELHWYTGMYICACCMRNDKFPPGIWGTFCTADGMGWFGDYHLNYNYEAPYYALTGANHTELLAGYMAPLNDFIPRGQRYAMEYFGCRGILYPVGIGPLGLETDIRPDTKEHGHLFLGQKSNAAYAAVIPMMHWYSTLDCDFAMKQYYRYLRETALFWEDYLVYSDGGYRIVNDALNEVLWWDGPDIMPTGQDERNPIISVGLVRMLMTLTADIAEQCGADEDKIPKWREIAAGVGPAKIVMRDGVPVLRGTDNVPAMRGLALQYMYPADGIGKYTTPQLYEAAKNTLEALSAWDNSNLFCSFYPAAARLRYDPDALMAHMNDCIQAHILPNGMFRFQGGGLENSAAVPATLQEMLLQSYEHILCLFPCWNRTKNIAFTGLRAKGAFVVDASVENGEIRAQIKSERGQLLRLERPGEGYVCASENRTVSLTEQITEIATVPGEIFCIYKI